MSAGKRLPATPEPMHEWRVASGLTLAGDAWGDPDGPLILLQHGGGQTRHAWKGAGMALGAAGYYAIAFDARGHGDSQWSPDGIYGQDPMVEDLISLIEILGNKRPVLVGASMGGGVSLVSIGEDRVDATALVLVDIGPRVEPQGVQRILDFMRHKPDGFDSLEEVAEAIASYQPHRKKPKDLSGLAKNLRQGDDGRFRWHWDPRFLIQRRDMDKRMNRMETCSRNLRLPTLLVRGGLSDVLSEDGAQAFLEMCPHSEYVNVTEAGHMVAGDRNDIFANAVIDFLSRTVPVHGEPLQKPHALNPADGDAGLSDIP
ncbi:MAG: alpha/beta hydrolase [Pseudomonadota bacterium]